MKLRRRLTSRAAAAAYAAVAVTASIALATSATATHPVDSPVTVVTNPTPATDTRTWSFSYNNSSTNYYLHYRNTVWDSNYDADESYYLGVPAGAGTFTFTGGTTYDLVDIEWHVQGEHHFDNGGTTTRPKVEVHFVHENPTDSSDKVIVAVHLTEVDTADDNDLHDKILRSNRPVPGGLSKLKTGVTLNNLLPSTRNTAWLYQGSLTSYPYTDGVQWVILKDTSLEISSTTLSAIRNHWSTHAPDYNARPLQTASPHPLTHR
ncbi:carbonic anhydrase family protein [Sinosporangium siamense]|uniref:carbonic anhydrase n=1 Tax=Sinosporangium siamense TaxID=1367973 RepID=A0A919V8U8_9ACTN|nr:carbonic anhydrase family protein [Sinosporangium siamense]GII96510.1 hypothetical protein Ssi02_67410 [Sinosporangium siamense]